jgi:heme/copper-type cytochrome/quinol oxidase subunit 3
MKRHYPVLDVAQLPTIAFGRRSPTWWGTVGFMVIEASTLVVAAVSYLYLRKNHHDWPPEPYALPSLIIPTISALLLALSNIPNRWLHKASRRMDKRPVQVGLLIMGILATIAVGIRIFDFRELNVHWDTNAYASAAWLTLSFHTMLLAFEMVETWVFAALFWFGPVEGKHFADVEDNCVYWYFMSLVWLPVYALLYLSPRWL